MLSFIYFLKKEIKFQIALSLFNPLQITHFAIKFAGTQEKQYFVLLVGLEFVRFYERKN